jgi:Fe2+ or Zn2+ uptake regulation protein
MPSVHEQVARRLAGLAQRYTPMRQALVAIVAAAGRPLSVPEISTDVADNGAGSRRQCAG